LNGHVGKDKHGFEEIMKVYGFGDRNEDGGKILQFSKSKKRNDVRNQATASICASINVKVLQKHKKT